MLELEGKIALVTGAGRPTGIGYALAMRLARDGADVAVADICKAETGDDPNYRGLAQAVAEIEKLGRKGLALNMDVTDEAAVGAGMERIKSELGGLQILCNNAGMAPAGIGLAHMLKPEAWRKTMAVNLDGVFLVSRAAVPLMIQGGKGGSIINTSSWRGTHPARLMAAYNVSKGAVLSLTRSMALELAPMGIRVNAICPGKVDTDMERMNWNLRAQVSGRTLEAVIKEEVSKVPMGRIAMPEEIANLAAFLASDQSGYITGQWLYITGGMDLFNE